MVGRIACVGDSNTYGYRGFGEPTANNYPAVLQGLLGDQFHVSNLGVLGAAAHRGGLSSYWNTIQFEELTSHRWDAVVVMLGTNDAKFELWDERCDEATDAHACTFWTDSKALIESVGSISSEVFLVIPPPVVTQGGYSINATVVNSILPRLLPLIAANGSIPGSHVVDAFGVLGGRQVDPQHLPSSGCTLDDVAAVDPPLSMCRWYCSVAWCDMVGDDPRHPAGAQRGAHLQPSPHPDPHLSPFTLTSTLTLTLILTLTLTPQASIRRTRVMIGSHMPCMQPSSPQAWRHHPAPPMAAASM